MRVEPTAIAGVLVLEPGVFGDARGFFMETWNERTFEGIGIRDKFVQDNHSRSRRNVLRRSSASFGRWVGTRLDAESHHIMWITAGFAHGFLVVSELADVQYKTTDYYAPEHERTLLWNDPALGIAWPLAGAPVMTDKDRNGTPLARAETYD